MRKLRIALAAGAVLLLAVAPAAPDSASAQPQDVSAMVDALFADQPDGDSKSLVLKDERARAYRAFYLSTHFDVKELRAYIITFRNVERYADKLAGVDTLVAEGKHAEAFDLLVGWMQLELGSKYVSDVGLDGIHDVEVAVGMGHMRDQFHRQQFNSHQAADQAYRKWLQQALELLERLT